MWEISFDGYEIWVEFDGCVLCTENIFSWYRPLKKFNDNANSENEKDQQLASVLQGTGIYHSGQHTRPGLVLTFKQSELLLCELRLQRAQSVVYFMLVMPGARSTLSLKQIPC